MKTAFKSIGAVFVLLSACWFAIFHVDWDFFGNAETTDRVSSISLLDGEVHLGLYEQVMWDAVLYTVIQTPDASPKSSPAHNAIINTPGQIVAKRTGSGSSNVETTLTATSNETARLCAGAECQTITCTLASQSCSAKRDQ